jgi:hypothetical protein
MESLELELVLVVRVLLVLLVPGIQQILEIPILARATGRGC